ncbi:MAG: bifunctional proline dehydrogenase/L-glutamate gamma-semialdehyde dehydrogenase PutA [Betaproteobacteria bacterium]|nr:MAG: bifunctional proline dehydrogenase/L-glutamate gamma-semialdehyde dehydrogenase PutA [Betaproteobacteria bacterium]
METAPSWLNALGPVAPWRARAEQLAAALLAAQSRSPPVFDVQRAFQWLPPESVRGRGLFRLAEALLRTPDRKSRRALLAEHVPMLGGRVRATFALPVVELAVGALGDGFVYAPDIERALARAQRAARRDPRARYSFDLLGEGVKTAAAAAHCTARYQAAIAAIGVQAQAIAARCGVSVKLSSIHERYDAASFARVRGEMLDRLLVLCRAAAGAGIGLTLDAEEAERAPLLLDLFAELALRPELRQWRGLGIVLQSYRVAAASALDAILQLARSRVEAGGQPLALRLVKGAYWDAEIKRAQELALERYPVFTDKRMTDLAYLACARRLLQHREVVAPQFATHNPATLGCVLALAEADTAAGHAAAADFEFQRLHGMGRALGRALAEVWPQPGVRTYAPVGHKRELLAYLARRLLENAASSSFVRQAARATDAKALLAENFAFLDGVPQPDRLPLPTELHMPQRRTARGFDIGDPATLASLAHAVRRARRHWRAGPMVEGIDTPGAARRVVSPARPEIVIGEVRDGSVAVAQAAVAAAFQARTGWASRDVAERAALLERLADLIEGDLPQLMSLCVWEAGKTLADALGDVREAVDFCRYYALQARRCLAQPQALAGPVGESNLLSLHGRGVFLCISPWNFPVAIYTGQIAAALVAGNSVVAKPAEQTPLTAYRVAELIGRAGFPPGVFQLVTGRGETIGQSLVEDPRIAGVAFTGSNPTARAIQLALARRDGPIVPLIAETGGVNAMIVDSTALPEQVVDAVIASAFRSAGQRCSSLRVLFLQQEIAPAVLELLRGAMAALRLGDPADLASDIGPVIDAQARSELTAYVDGLRARAQLIAEAGPLPASGHYVAPVAFEVRSMRDVPGERFGPILHVVRFAIDDLDRVVDDINATGYGLTLGVQTRLDSRAEQVRRRAAVGNLYVNRNMIGAVVGVQPFGGEGLSGTGPKAGGPHYLSRFVTERVCTVNTAAAGGDLALLTDAAAISRRGGAHGAPGRL